MRATWAAALVVASSACSWLFVEPAPSTNYPKAEPTCTERRELPMVDATTAGLSVLFSLTLLSTTAGDDSGVNQALGTPLLIAAVPYGLSAWSGFRRTAACRRARGGYRELMLEYERQRREEETRPGILD